MIGNQLDMETDLGPIASQEQLNTICRYVQIGKEEGLSWLMAAIG